MDELVTIGEISEGVGSAGTGAADEVGRCLDRSRFLLKRKCSNNALSGSNTYGREEEIALAKLCNASRRIWFECSYDTVRLLLQLLQLLSTQRRIVHGGTFLRFQGCQS